MTISDVPYTQNYLTEDGSLQIAFKLPNAFTRWRSLNKDYFCLDYEALSTNMTVIKPIFRVAFNNRQAQNKKGFYFKAGALLISCSFLMAVLVVYCILPELRTIGGKVLMACVASLFSAYMLLATMMLMTLNNENITIVNCISLTSAIYFFFMASFFWMNVMSWDIWWSFRGFAKIRPINRRGDSFKYFIYSIYAWGLPFGMLVMFVILNQIQVPGIISPSVPKFGCFIDGPEKMLYFYVPMLVLLICNWVLFLMTAFNIWRINKSTTMLNSAAAGTPAAHRAQRQRFLVYIKLSVVMGISFVLEVTSTQAPQLAIWYITDMYNMLIGVTIFFIFVCKKKIFRMLSEKLQKNRESKQQHNASETNVTYIDEQPYIDEHKEHFLLQNNTHNA
ncbi:unnamed protein product [Parnassius apollo]|uniref:(apollo) hypothetical protein n=1 Tax=Parnassius apollo TaxID=110799 RepID=A0A8S3Y0R9_PARAO|nr:unnamed protein product [Parnassius apollo]